jgi:hypothetical protein
MKTIRFLVAAVVSVGTGACAPDITTPRVVPDPPKFDGMGFSSGNRSGGFDSAATTTGTADSTAVLSGGATAAGGMGYGSGN